MTPTEKERDIPKRLRRERQRQRPKQKQRQRQRERERERGERVWWNERKTRYIYNIEI